MHNEYYTTFSHDDSWRRTEEIRFILHPCPVSTACPPTDQSRPLLLGIRFSDHRHRNDIMMNLYNSTVDIVFRHCHNMSINNEFSSYVSDDHPHPLSQSSDETWIREISQKSIHLVHITSVHDFSVDSLDLRRQGEIVDDLLPPDWPGPVR